MKTSEKLIIFSYKTLLQLLSRVNTTWTATMAFRIFSTPHRKPRSVPPGLFGQCEEFDLRVNGLRMHGYKWNSQSAKKVLIVHGFESRAYNFERYVGPLLQKGYGVYAMDAKGHGKSEGKTIILPEYVEMMKTLEDAVGKFHGYICHSFGGMATCLYQEQFNHPQARIVLIAPATETSTAVTFFCRFFGLSAKVEKAIYALVKKKSGQEVSYFSVKRITKKINNPMLWVHDKDDTITPLEDALPIKALERENIEFCITEGLGHRKIYKDPGVIQKVIEFL
jgi:pimeloyl-ACP methyl ester carboxylesterase